jgi:alanyl-tRNA synthetase
MTEKLYYEDSHLRRFAATVLSCSESGDRYKIILDRTAFFPGGGGQPADRGHLGGIPVEGAFERDGEIVHLACDALPPGSLVTGELDWDRRFRFMQCHSGEHIVSGCAHRLFRAENVGFHLSEDGCTLDFDRELNAEELLRLETEANDAVFRDLAVSARFMPPSVLPSVEYRSKKELEGDVRLVNVEGVDVCACCAPHVSRTGEIGLVRLTDAMRHRGGMRLTLLCGWLALEDYRRKGQSVSAISQKLSAKPDETPGAVDRVLGELGHFKQRAAERSRELAALRAASLRPTEGNLCLFDEGSDTAAIRELANAGASLCGGVCAVFSGGDGTGYKYIIGSRRVDLQSAAGKINAAISGRGGGSAGMIQGSAAAPRAVIEAYFSRETF